MARLKKIPPLVILFIDSGDPDFIERWANEGYLPTIQSIMKQGCWSRIVGQEHLTEHGTSLSLFSGISRNQHGYLVSLK